MVHFSACYRWREGAELLSDSSATLLLDAPETLYLFDTDQQALAKAWCDPLTPDEAADRCGLPLSLALVHGTYWARHGWLVPAHHPRDPQVAASPHRPCPNNSAGTDGIHVFGFSDRAEHVIRSHLGRPATAVAVVARMEEPGLEALEAPFVIAHVDGGRLRVGPLVRDSNEYAALRRRVQRAWPERSVSETTWHVARALGPSAEQWRRARRLLREPGALKGRSVDCSLASTSGSGDFPAPTGPSPIDGGYRVMSPLHTLERLRHLISPTRGTIGAARGARYSPAPV